MTSNNGPHISNLVTFGLSENEARVYVALLEIGRSTVSQISRKANINRTTGYDVLTSLVNKRLARISGKEPKQEYAAESPDNIIELLENQLEETRSNIEKARALIPSFKSIHNVEDRPHIKFYEGSEGLKQVYEDTLTATETILAYANIEHMHAALPGYFPNYYQRRAAKGIFGRGILPKTPASIERAKHNVEEARETALVPLDKLSFSPEVCIYDNKVMIASWREKLGIIIESHEIAEAMKQIFELAWGEAKRLEKETRG